MLRWLWDKAHILSFGLMFLWGIAELCGLIDSQVDECVSAIAPLVGAALITTGGQLLGGLGGLIGGPSKSQRMSRNIFDIASEERNKQPFNPQTIFQNLQYGLEPQFQEQAQGLSKRLGLSSPLAQAGLAKQRQSAMAQLFGQIQMQSLAQQSQRDLQLLNLMLSSAQSS